MSKQPEALRLADSLENRVIPRADTEGAAVELRRLCTLRAELIEALNRINEWCCFATEEDVSARLMALQQIGQAARAAIAKAES
jgi:hypothetical protein